MGRSRKFAGPRRGDFVAGITVALVLVPQSVAYAVLAGLPPVHGLYAAAVAPILAGLVGSSPYLQTGPVALTSLLTLGALAPHWEQGSATYAVHAALLALMVGVIRVAVGLVRGGFIAYLLSQPVVSAFTLAAGVLIAASQVPQLLGLDSGSTNPVVAAVAALGRPGAWSLTGMAIGVAVLAITLGARRLHPLLPGALIGTVIALVLVKVGVDVAVVGDIGAGLPKLELDLPWTSIPSLVVSAVVIALIGFAEPASIARRYASADRTLWDPDREFVGQGLANLGAGLVAGYPVGGSFSRSSLNHLSGARTRWSGVITGAVVLAVLPVANVLADLPAAALAGLVIASVVPLLNPEPLWRARRLSRPQFAVGVVTAGVSMAAAPQVHYGVLAGVGLALAVHLWRELGLDIEVWRDRDRLHVRPQGVLYFGSAPLLETRILAELAAHRDLAHVTLHLQRLGRIDLTGALVLRAICRDLRRAGVPVAIQGVQPHTRRLVEAVFAKDSVDYTRAPATGPDGSGRVASTPDGA